MAENIEARVKKMNEVLDQLAKDAAAVGDIAPDKRSTVTFPEIFGLVLNFK
jgi:hypothetical protein